VKQQQQEDGEFWVFLKFQKPPLLLIILLDQSLNHLGKEERSGVFNT